MADEEKAHGALVEQVGASSAFGKSARLRELFLFLCRRRLENPGAGVREQEIGAEVFGRHPDYDTAQDAIVRVQVSQLRKRLEQYFATEGRHHSLIVEIPKGSYTPVFRLREAHDFREAEVRPRFRLAVILGAAVLLVAAVVMLWPGHMRRESAVRKLWDQIFDNGHPTCIVLSDSMLVLFEDAIHRQLTLNEYRDKSFVRLADLYLKDPVENARWKEQIGSYFTHVTDSRLAATFAVLNAGRKLPTEIVIAQDFGVNYLQSHNLILVGTRRSNPWVEVFEDQMNFRSGFQEGPPMMSYFENRAPQPGEAAVYNVAWTKQGYCRVAFLPNPTRGGNTLVISGTEMASSEAGGQFMSSERWIEALRAKLKLGPKARVPYFEVLLRVDYMTWNTPKFEIVAARVH